MKYNILLLALIPAVLMVGFILEAHAQIGSYYTDTSVINGGAQKNCTNVSIDGAMATTPITLTLIFDHTTDASITTSNAGSSNPIYEKTGQTLVWYTNDTDHYTLKAVLNYPSDEKRDVSITLAGTNGKDQEDIQYSGTTFCRIFDITTVPPVHIPTREEILGQDILNVPQTLNNLVTTQQYNTEIESNTFSTITTAIYIVIALVAILIIIFAANREMSRRTKLQIAESLRTVRTMAQENTTKAEAVKKMYEDLAGRLEKQFMLFGGLLVEMKNNLVFTQNEREKIEQLMKKQKEIEQSMFTPEKKKSYVRALYDKIIKTDTKSLRIKLKQLRSKLDDESKTEAEAIENELKKRGNNEKNTLEETGIELNMLESKEDKVPKRPSDEDLQKLFVSLMNLEITMESIDNTTLDMLYEYKSKINSPEDFPTIRSIFAELEKRWKKENNS